MWTIEYKGAYIHGYIDCAECSIQWSKTSYRLYRCKSLHAAKCRITRSIKRDNQGGNHA